MTAPHSTSTGPAAPEGFRPLKAEESTGPRVDKESLRQGVILQFKGTRRFARSNDNGVTVVHIFVNRGGKGMRFSVFGTAQLDSKLRNAPAGAILWLAYGGKKLINGQETHDWNISDGGLRLTEEQVFTLCKNSVREHDALDVAIRAAERDNAERKHAAGAGAPDYDEREYTDEEAAAASRG